MVVLKNQNRRSGIFYLRPLCGFGFFSKSDFSAKIYRVGVLLYGMPPKFSNIMKTVFKKQ